MRRANGRVSARRLWRRWPRRARALGVKMRDRAGADISDEWHFGFARRFAPAADEARRLDAEVIRRERDFVGAQTARAVEEIGDGGGRTSQSLGEAAAGFAGFLERLAYPVDCHIRIILVFRTNAIENFRKLLDKTFDLIEHNKNKRLPPRRIGVPPAKHGSIRWVFPRLDDARPLPIRRGPRAKRPAGCI